MSSFLITNKTADIEGANVPCSFYGSYKHIYNKNNIEFILNALEEKEQIYTDEVNDLVLIFDGINYTPNQNLLDLYKKYGEEFIKEINGEFALCLFDFKNNISIISADTFGTRQIYFALDSNEFCISTLYSSIKVLGFDYYTKIYENNYAVFNLKTNSFELKPITKFDFTEKKDNSDDWVKAFEEAVLMKTADSSNVTLLLSDGIDSGAIACCLEKYNKPFNSISYITDDYYPNDLFYWRAGISTKDIPKNITLKKSSNKQLFFLTDLPAYNCNFIFDTLTTKYFLENNCFVEHDLSKKNIESEFTFKVMGHVASVMKEHKSSTLITGHGAAFSDIELKLRFNKTNNIRACNYDDPYVLRNLCGPHKIENRFPLLDKKLFQETLWLNKQTFNTYKKHVIGYLKQHNYPYSLKNGEINVRGFLNCKYTPYYYEI
jgi:hypothetical protein